LGEAGLAVADFTQALSLKKDNKDDNAQAYCLRGLARADKGEHEKAIEDLTKALELKADLAEALRGRGIAYNRTGKYAEATKDLEKAAGTLSEDAEAQNELGVAQAGTGEHGKAVSAFSKAIEIKDDLADAYYNRGVSHEANGDLDKAIADYSKAIELNWDLKPLFKADPALEADLKAGSFSDRLRQTFRENNISPSANVEIKWEDEQKRWRVIDLGADRVYFALKRGGALAWAQLRKYDARSFRRRAAVREKKGDFDGAIADYGKAIEVEPDIVTLVDRASTAVRKGDPKAAVGFYEEALKRWPNSRLALNDLAWLLSTCTSASCRDGKRAVELARRTVKLDTKSDPQHLDTLAAAYAEAGRFDEAVKTQKEAIALLGSGEGSGDFKARLALYERRKPYRTK
ncbi:MAG: tetratricopeptide repeat protein, partial [Planctomycetota bacterium]